MKTFLSKFFLGVFAVSMIAMASCGDEKKDDEKKDEDKKLGERGQVWLKDLENGEMETAWIEYDGLTKVEGVTKTSRAFGQKFESFPKVLAIAVLLFAFSSPLAAVPFAVYGLALATSGALESRRQRRFSSLLGVPLCLLMLHTSFSLGLVDGLLRKGRLPKDRQ